MAKRTHHFKRDLQVIYSRIGNNVRVPMMALPRIYQAGQNVLEAGGTLEAAEASMQAVLDEVRTN
jgi:hypothetical protein